MASIPTTPSQTVGPFFHFLVTPASHELVSPDHAAAVRFEGRITDGDGLPVPDAMVELWQADTAGRYPHPEDPGRGGCEPGFTGFARAATDADGRYSFITVRPGAMAGHAPHIAVSIFARGLLDRLATRAYIPGDDHAMAVDPVLTRVEQARRRTLIARDEADRLVFDIRLQGEGETVFFDV